MKKLKKNEIAAIKELKNILSASYKLVQLKLFGSKAKGNFTDESDLDLLIVLENNDWRIEKEIYGLCFEISLKYDVLLSPVIFSRVEFNNDLTKITPFYKIVTQEGIIL